MLGLYRQAPNFPTIPVTPTTETGQKLITANAAFSEEDANWNARPRFSDNWRGRAGYGRGYAARGYAGRGYSGRGGFAPRGDYYRPSYSSGPDYSAGSRGRGDRPVSIRGGPRGRGRGFDSRSGRGLRRGWRPWTQRFRRWVRPARYAGGYAGIQDEVRVEVDDPDAEAAEYELQEAGYVMLGEEQEEGREDHEIAGPPQVRPAGLHRSLVCGQGRIESG